MNENRSPFVVDPDWLAANLDAGVKIVDASCDRVGRVHGHGDRRLGRQAFADRLGKSPVAVEEQPEMAFPRDPA